MSFPLLTTGCDAEADDPGGGVSPGKADTEDPCAEVCTGIPRDVEPRLSDRESEEAQNWATCFSCRCKSALGVLPTPDELRCSGADGPLTRWRPQRSAEGRVVGIEALDPNGTDTDECLNPGIAAAGCDLQSRFKRMLYNEGNTEFQLLCRKERTDSVGYYEYLLIGHNQTNGATCFWQAQDRTFDGETVPSLDLSAASADDKKAYTNTFYLYSQGPTECTGCHAADAFLLSPYLRSAWSIEQAREDRFARSRIRRNKPYTLVTADQAEPQPVVDPANDLTAPGQPLASDCGSCHRVVKDSSYCGFAADSLAEDLGLGNINDDDRQALFTHAASLMHWMPPEGAGTLDEALALQSLVQDACR